MQRPLFDTPEEAISTTFTIVTRLCQFVMWLVFWMVHLIAVIAAMVLCWAYQVTPADAMQWYETTMQSKPVVSLTAVGFSALSVAVGYWWVLRKIHRNAAMGWFAEYLSKGA